MAILQATLLYHRFLNYFTFIGCSKRPVKIALVFLRYVATPCPRGFRASNYSALFILFFEHVLPPIIRSFLAIRNRSL